MATVQQIKADLTSKVGVAMEGVKRKVADIFVRVVTQYYGEYVPKQYIRTFQIMQLATNLANAAVKVRQVGASFEIYFDAGAMSHPTGNWSESRILDNVMLEGTHGNATSGGTAVWTQGVSILNPQIKSIVKQELIAAGIPIH